MGLIVDMKMMGGAMDVQTVSFEGCFLGCFILRQRRTGINKLGDQLLPIAQFTFLEMKYFTVSVVFGDVHF